MRSRDALESRPGSPDEKGTGRVGPGATSPRVAADRLSQLLLAGRGRCRRGALPVQEKLWPADGTEGYEGMSPFAEARSFRLYLTERGRALEGPVARCWAQTEEKAFAGLGAGEGETFRKSLIWVRSNLDPGFRAE